MPTAPAHFHSLSVRSAEPDSAIASRDLSITQMEYFAKFPAIISLPIAHQVPARIHLSRPCDFCDHAPLNSGGGK